MLESFGDIGFGTRLIVRKDLKEGETYDGWTVTKPIAQLAGMEVEVYNKRTTYDGHEKVYVVGLSTNLGWTPPMFECFATDGVSLMDLIAEEGDSNA